MDVSWPTFIWRSKRGKGEDIRRERENGYYTQSPPTAGGADSYIPCYIPFLSFFSFLVLYGLCLYYGKEYFFFLARDITNQTLNNSHGHNNNNKKKKKNKKYKHETYIIIIWIFFFFFFFLFLIAPEVSIYYKQVAHPQQIEKSVLYCTYTATSD